jgi:poly(A) polymerase
MRAEITRSSPARVLEEFFKLLRQGAAAKTFRLLHELGLLAYLMPEADAAMGNGNGALLESLERLDAWRAATQPSAERMSQPVLLGSIFVPLGLSLARGGAAPRKREAPPEEPLDLDRELAELGGDEREDEPTGPMSLPVARRDLDRLRLVILAARRLADKETPKNVLRVLARKAYFDDVLAWLEIHGDAETRERVVGVWEDMVAHPDSEGDEDDKEPRRRDTASPQPKGAASGPNDAAVRKRRRRRRRRRPSTSGGDAAGSPPGEPEVV